jgi:uncharacterized RDD family membrane protein YckC
MAVTTNKAGFWIRTFAYLIDAIGVGTVSALIGPVIAGRRSDARYARARHQGRAHRRFGAHADELIRYVGLFVSFIRIFIGVIWVAFDADKQGWHDKIAGTYVVRTK